MKKKISLKSVLTALMYNLVAAILTAPSLGAAPAIIFGVLTLAGFVPMPAGLAFMAIQKEIWEADIEEAIFPDSSFVSKAYNADEYVLSGKVVHIPQSGGAGSVVKNRTSLPASIRKRSDTDITYALDEYTTDPVLIPNADTVELSYDKRNSVLGEDKMKLQNYIANELLYSWLSGLPTGSILATSGVAAAATAPGATGTRKLALVADLQAARTKLANQGRWFDGLMYALVPSNLIPQLFPAGDIVTATYMQSVSEDERRRGIIAKVQGFNIMERATGAIYSKTGTLSAQGAATDVGDCEAIVCWYQNAVERAKGEVVPFEQVGDPTMYGDVYSFLARAGGRRRRSDNTGIVAIAQAWVS